MSENSPYGGPDVRIIDGVPTHPDGTPVWAGAMPILPIDFEQDTASFQAALKTLGVTDEESCR